MITERTKLMEVERQLDWREAAYPGKVEARAMRDSDAQFTLTVWREIVADYRAKVEAAEAMAVVGKSREAEDRELDQ